MLICMQKAIWDMNHECNQNLHTLLTGNFEDHTFQIPYSIQQEALIHSLNQQFIHWENISQGRGHRWNFQPTSDFPTSHTHKSISFWQLKVALKPNSYTW